MPSITSTLRFIADHPLTANHKWSAYARLLRWQIESRMRDEVEVDWIEGARLVARKGMTGATGNIYCGLHEFEDMAFLLHLLRPSDLFVDVGSNIGSYTVLSSAVCKARTIAIEPHPSTVLSLRRNISVNDISDRVQIIEAALGASAGLAQFTTDMDTMNQVTDECSNSTIQVDVRTLDSVLHDETPTLIKMDAEGYEKEIIRGAEKTLSSPQLQAIITENAETEVLSVLKRAGFEVAEYDPFRRTLGPRPNDRSKKAANTLFVRDIEACLARIKDSPRRKIFKHYL